MSTSEVSVGRWEAWLRLGEPVHYIHLDSPQDKNKNGSISTRCSPYARPTATTAAVNDVPLILTKDRSKPSHCTYPAGGVFGSAPPLEFVTSFPSRVSRESKTARSWWDRNINSLLLHQVCLTSCMNKSAVLNGYNFCQHSVTMATTTHHIFRNFISRIWKQKEKRKKRKDVSSCRQHFPVKKESFGIFFKGAC